MQQKLTFGCDLCEMREGEEQAEEEDKWKGEEEFVYLIIEFWRGLFAFIFNMNIKRIKIEIK